MAILLVFLITAILVRVPLDALTFFVITMIKIMLINCKRSWRGSGAEISPHLPTLPSDPASQKRAHSDPQGNGCRGQ